MKKLFAILIVFVVVALGGCAENFIDDEVYVPASETPQYVQTYTPYAESYEYEQLQNSHYEETAFIRFYYSCSIIDYNIEGIPESFLYNTEEIPVENFNEHFIRLMYEHTGISILDLWFDDSKVYVNLPKVEAEIFDMSGSTGASIRMNILNRTVASLPGITSFEILVDGQRGVSGWHFGFNYVAIVENGRLAGFDFFNFHIGK